jgi:NAD(P)-dependent dehydrogenase (short-subunit alcohol dehydrogenase family)
MAPSRVALVTGASRNIGRCIALALAREGADIVCVGRDAGMLDETAAAVRALGRRAAVARADAADNAALEQVPGFAIEAFGRLDVLVNNAGGLRDGLPQDIPPAQFAADLQVNLVAQYTLARAAHPHLKASGAGVVVNIGSIAGSIAFPRCPSYVTSKAAIGGLTRSLAMDWARDGIRVVCVAPGYVESDISRDVLADAKARDWIVKRIPLRRVAQPEEVGEFVAFVASDRARFCTGETYYVDGGQRMAI